MYNESEFPEKSLQIIRELGSDWIIANQRLGVDLNDMLVKHGGSVSGVVAAIRNMIRKLSQENKIDNSPKQGGGMSR